MDRAADLCVLQVAGSTPALGVAPRESGALFCCDGRKHLPRDVLECIFAYMNNTNMTTKEAILNAASLTYGVAQAIGSDASDAWTAMLAMYGVCDSRILAGYSFEAEFAFVGIFA